jgi:hypothetical protein
MHLLLWRVKLFSCQCAPSLTFKNQFRNSVSSVFVASWVRCKEWHVDVVNKHGAGCIGRLSCGAWV